ncbi:MAG: exodeoxyribonuclease VII large subunit, partial [Parcubacteria group bacterium]|nr:exodeoxyribonuclease VII large subunit [Parcubacteria group bacterium]
VYTVSEFNHLVNDVLAAYPVVVEGEISEFRVQHNLVFFVMTDGKSSTDCFSMIWNIDAPVELCVPGTLVRVYGKPGLYAKSGRFRIQVERMQLAGEGALKQAFELLKAKLDAEGLFAQERKRPIPAFPKRIGLVTSRDAAAYTDVLKVLRERWGGLTIRFIHTPVQGIGAVSKIVEALQFFSDTRVELVVLTRGGGSLEDLHAFNSEKVARAIFSSRAPVVVGVGHERDETLADFVADIRASTPSNAAELIVPHRREISWQVKSHCARVHRAITRILAAYTDDTAHHVLAIRRGLRALTHAMSHRIQALAPLFTFFRARILRIRSEISQLTPYLYSRVRQLLGEKSMHLTAHERILIALSPTATLERGYSIVYKKGSRAILRDARDISIRERIDILLARGRIESEVTETHSG